MGRAGGHVGVIAVESMLGRCWECGRYTLATSYLCYRHDRKYNHVAWYAVHFGVHKGELIDHGKVHMPCP